jgi:hypothetical protein
VIDPVRAAESNTAMIVTVMTVFHAIALVFVALRVYARAFVIKTFGTDDVFMVLSAVCPPAPVCGRERRTMAAWHADDWRNSYLH